ncbi:MAG: methionine--tRNA ligase [Gammaproteobacteria bacterium]
MSHSPSSQADTPRQMLITCALPYANGPIHLGHALEHIQADIWARFQRMRGVTCLFVCADDTHGTPVMLRAEQEGISPEALIDKFYEEHRRDLSGLLIQYDHYYTTHSPENQQLANLIFKRNDEIGAIGKKTIQQLYDPERGLFLADRYVKGECPQCGATDQYGDNCDQCGASYNPTDLKNPSSVVSGATPELRHTEQLFFDLPQFADMLKDWVSGPALQPEIANKLREWLDAGLQPWDISREAPYFGFEIPGHPGKYFYVWMDAPIGYMASHQHYCNTHATPQLDFDSVWQSNSSVELYHFIGKDIINFHGLFWPAMLTGANMRLPSGIFAHGFVTLNGEKMSKSKGNYITTADYLAQLSPEYLRYFYATKLSPKVQDVDLNLTDFVQRCNSDLVGKFVNIASRCASFITKGFDGQLSSEPSNRELLETIQAAQHTIASLYEAREFARAMREIFALADKVNQYIDTRAPWTMAKDPALREQVQRVCTTGINAFRLLTIYLKPVLPTITQEAEAFLNSAPLCWADLNTLLLNHTIKPVKPMVTRLTDKQVKPYMAPPQRKRNRKKPKGKKRKKKITKPKPYPLKTPRTNTSRSTTLPKLIYASHAFCQQHALKAQTNCSN